VPALAAFCTGRGWRPEEEAPGQEAVEAAAEEELPSPAPRVSGSLLAIVFAVLGVIALLAAVLGLVVYLSPQPMFDRSIAPILCWAGGAGGLFLIATAKSSPACTR